MSRKNDPPMWKLTHHLKGCTLQKLKDNMLRSKKPVKCCLIQFIWHVQNGFLRLEVEWLLTDLSSILWIWKKKKKTLKEWIAWYLKVFQKLSWHTRQPGITDIISPIGQHPIIAQWYSIRGNSVKVNYDKKKKKTGSIWTKS